MVLALVTTLIWRAPAMAEASGGVSTTLASVPVGSHVAGVAVGPSGDCGV
jgi:hypothetical protein